MSKGYTQLQHAKTPVQGARKPDGVRLPGWQVRILEISFCADGVGMQRPAAGRTPGQRCKNFPASICCSSFSYSGAVSKRFQDMTAAL